MVRTASGEQGGQPRRADTGRTGAYVPLLDPLRVALAAADLACLLRAATVRTQLDSSPSGMHDKSTARASVGSPYPAGREPLSPRQDIHVLTRARAVHGALVATQLGRASCRERGCQYL